MTKTLARLLLLTLLVATASCKKSGGTAGNDNGTNANASGQTGGTSSTPPFVTKEPERYQAVRVISTSGDTGAGGAEAAPGVGRTFIARDRDKRLEEYETEGGEKISYLQLPEGNFVLLPAKKIYAELKPEESGRVGEREESIPQDFSPERLLNETRPESRYEKLGAETVNGRATLKYRVTILGKTGAGREVTTESIVWVDEALGMPVRTETASTGGTAATTPGAKVVTELIDIKETVDAGLFALPSDYRKVLARELYAEMKRAETSGTGKE